MGDENAGKSSTLERIAMVNVLPRSENICTRQPIALKLRHAEDIPSTSPLINLRIPRHVEQDSAPGQENGYLDVRLGLSQDEVREAIEKHMQKLAENGLGIVMGEEIEVEVHSNGVPTIDFIDLPGLFAVRVSTDREPHNLAEMTEKCTRHYLTKESTGAVVCVLDATMDNLRTSKALRLVQDARQDLWKFTIGVLAKADRCYDRDWEGNGFHSPFWKLEDRLRGVAPDYVELEGGYFAIKNRVTQMKKTRSLQEHNAHEEEWFLEQFPADDDIRNRMGITALVGRVDRVFHQHLAGSYVPHRMEALRQQEEQCKQELKALGRAPEELCVSDLLDHLKALLEQRFSPATADSICEAVESALPFGEIDGSTRYEHIMGKKVLMAKHVQCVADGILVQHVVKRFVGEVGDLFKSDNQGDFQLRRFDSLRQTVEQTVERHVRGRADEFSKTALHVLQTTVQVSHGSDLNPDKLRKAMGDCAMWTLIAPVIAVDSGELGFFQDIRNTVVCTPEESWAGIRAEWLDQLRHIQKSMDALKEIQRI